MKNYHQRDIVSPILNKTLVLKCWHCTKICLGLETFDRYKKKKKKKKLLQISLFEIGAAVAQLLASGRLFDPQNETRYHRHGLAVSGTLNTIIYLKDIFN